MFERFAHAARTAVEDARFEAGRRGDRRIGSEHLLLALLQDDDLAQLVGVDAVAAHDAADQLDRTALAAIGLTLGEFQPTSRVALGRHASLMTSGAKAVIQQSLANAAAEKARTITSRHMLLALLDRPEPDPAATLLAALPIDQPALRSRLAAIA
jgi:ATP-dependent Clp protease ATP-binding subunit ClpA